MNNDLYREEILEHYRFPKNCQKPTNFSHFASLGNPLCGDEMTVYLQIKNKKIISINYQIKGCAISVYSASFLSEALRGQSLVKISKMDQAQVLSLLKLKLTPTRAKCALLPYLAIKKALR